MILNLLFVSFVIFQLCVCDIKKARWYVEKDLGFLVKEDPLTVRLKFEPSGRPEGPAGKI